MGSAGFSIPTNDDAARLVGNAIASPQNMPEVEADLNEELAHTVKVGFTADEVEKAKKTWLDQRSVPRTEDGQIAYTLMSRERWGRTLQWDAKLEAAVAALTLEQVNAAFKRHVNPAAISFVKSWDFKKGARTGSSFRWIEFRSCELYPAAS